ncbi:MAG TPA: TonB family protein [Anaeromyxobacter sp.]|nr:TonB family protein [Anaeromyxobacter sp.]
MGLVASSSELPLIDLLQVKGQARASCRISVMGRDREGSLHLLGGEVIHATYGPLRGEDAAYAILAEESLQYRAASDAAAPRPNMRLSPGVLALEAARRADEAGRHVVPIESARSARPPPGPAARPGSPSRPPRRRLGVLVAVGAAVLAIAGVGAAVLHRRPAAPPPATEARSPAAPPPAVAAPPAEPLEASALHPPADTLPVLTQGSPPRAPDPAATLRPTIVCRVLVGADGVVIRSEIYQRRPDLAAFEDAALQAVREYRFEPGRRAGTPVPVWVNWPVDFI